MIATFSINAQTTDPAPNSKKNTLGIRGLGILPIFDQTRNGEGEYGLMYTRRLNTLSLRSSLNFTHDKSVFSGRNSALLTPSVESDTLWTSSLYQEQLLDIVDFRVGVAMNRQRNKSNWSIGLDVFTGHRKARDTDVESLTPFLADNMGGQPTAIEGVYRTVTIGNNYSNWFSGFSPTIGWEYAFSKTFGAAIMYRPTFAFNHATKRVQSSVEYEFPDFDLVSEYEELETVIAPNNRLQTNIQAFEFYLTVSF